MSVPNFTQNNKEILEEIKKCHAVYSGGGNVKQYLTKSTNESKQGFESRKRVSACGTTFKKGINSIVNILFRNTLSFSDDIPEQIKEYYKTADGRASLNEIAKEITREILLSNKVYVLTWTPQNDAKNALEERIKGIRPYFEVITADREIDSITKYDANGKLERLCIMGTYIAESTRYEDIKKDEYRVYFSDGTLEIFRPNNKGIMELYDTIQSEIKEIPIQELTFNRVSHIPPFTNEANYQLQQYNLESSKDAYNEKLAFPFVVTWGMMANNRDIAVSKIDENGNPVQVVEFQANKGIDFSVNAENGAKLGDVEIKELSGDADAVLLSSIERKEKSIRDGFIKMVSEGNGSKTVSEAESQRVAGESEIAALSSKIETFLNSLHILFSKMNGDTTVQGTISTNKEFIEQGLTELRYKMLMDLYADDTIDREAFLKELQDSGELTTIDTEALNNRLIANGTI